MNNINWAWLSVILECRDEIQEYERNVDRYEHNIDHKSISLHELAKMLNNAEFTTWNLWKFRGLFDGTYIEDVEGNNIIGPVRVLNELVAPEDNRLILKGLNKILAENGMPIPITREVFDSIYRMMSEEETWLSKMWRKVIG